MIAHLHGILLVKNSTLIIVEVAGIGYQLQVSLTTLAQLPAIGDDIKIHTQLIVREDAQDLYGFSSIDEKQMFQILIKVSGIGAKVGLAILSHLSVDNLSVAIHNSDVDLLVKTPGIGKKTAERLILELKDKLTATINLTNAPIINSNQQQAIAALESLGYKHKDAVIRINKLDPATPVDKMIKLALQQ